MDFLLRSAPTQFFPSQNIILLPSSKNSDLRFILEQKLKNNINSGTSENFDSKSNITQTQNSLNEISDDNSDENTSMVTQSDSGGLLQEIINKKNEEKQKIIYLKKKRKEIKKQNLLKKQEKEKEQELINKNNKEQMNFIRNKFFRTSFKYYNEQDNLNVTYKYQTESKNYLFFFCSLRPSCPGTCKINKLYSKVEITTKCNPDIDHNILSIEEFNILCDTNKLETIDFSNSKYQSMYVAYIIKNNMNIQNDELFEVFNKNTGIKLKLKNSEISNIRNKVTNSFNDLDVEDIIEKINFKEGDISVIMKSFDIKYQKEEYDDKLKKKIMIDKIGKVIIFGDKNMIINLNNKNIEEYYFDTSFKIIQKKMQYFKFLIISGYDISDSTIKICLYIFIEYPDINSYIQAFKYLKEEYNFNPKFIFHDFDEKLINALDNENFFNPKPVKNLSFFYYEKLLRNKTKIISPSRKNINLSCLEFIINVLLLSLINIDKTEKMKQIIYNQCNINEECFSLFDYLNKNYLSKFFSDINISHIINTEEIKKFYEIKNRCELLNINLEHFLPRYPINTNIFVSKFRQIFSNNNAIVKYDKTNIKQKYDFHLETLIYIIKEKNLNENPIWINVEIYINTLMNIIKEKSGINDNKILDEIFKEINYWNIIDYSEKNIEKLLADDSDDLFETRKEKDSEVGDNDDNVFSLDCIKDLGKINTKNKKNYQAPKKVEY